MAERTIIIDLIEQTPAVRTLRFTPDLSSVDDSVLLQKRYEFVTDESGEGSFELPVKSSGSIRYEYDIPKGKGRSTGEFYLSAGAPISLATLISTGGSAIPDSVIDYVDDAVVPTINNQTGRTYTLQPSDRSKWVTFTNALSITVTVPANLGVRFNCVIHQLGLGQVTIVGDGATINNIDGETKITGRYGVATLFAYAADTFIFTGNTST